MPPELRLSVKFIANSFYSMKGRSYYGNETLVNLLNSRNESKLSVNTV